MTTDTPKHPREAESICRECAKANGAVWPADHYATWWFGACDVCGHTPKENVCAGSDWLWPSQTPASRALEAVNQADDTPQPETLGELLYHIPTIRAALRIAHAIDSGELVKRLGPNDKFLGRSKEDSGFNDCLERLKKIRSE